MSDPTANKKNDEKEQEKKEANSKSKEDEKKDKKEEEKAENAQEGRSSSNLLKVQPLSLDEGKNSLPKKKDFKTDSQETRHSHPLQTKKTNVKLDEDKNEPKLHSLQEKSKESKMEKTKLFEKISNQDKPKNSSPHRPIRIVSIKNSPEKSSPKTEQSDAISDGDASQALMMALLLSALAQEDGKAEPRSQQNRHGVVQRPEPPLFQSQPERGKSPTTESFPPEAVSQVKVEMRNNNQKLINELKALKNELKQSLKDTSKNIKEAIESLKSELKEAIVHDLPKELKSAMTPASSSN